MENLVTAVRALGERKSALESELAKVNQELRAISAALAAASARHAPADASTRTAAATKAAVPPAESAPHTVKRASATKAPASRKRPVPAGAAAKPAGEKAVPRSWFKPGEAQGLFEKLLKTPMRPPQLVSEIVVLKGNQNLPKPDLARFKWATAAALKAAVRTKKLVKSGGKLALPAARKRAAKGKSASR
jgi:hypothetical protein